MTVGEQTKFVGFVLNGQNIALRLETILNFDVF